MSMLYFLYWGRIYQGEKSIHLMGIESLQFQINRFRIKLLFCTLCDCCCISFSLSVCAQSCLMFSLCFVNRNGIIQGGKPQEILRLSMGCSLETLD